jgi:hypothetical protein
LFGGAFLIFCFKTQAEKVCKQEKFVILSKIICFGQVILSYATVRAGFLLALESLPKE